MAFSRVYVEITNICNMQCSFCHGHSREFRRMSENEFSHVLDALAGKANYLYYHLMGEPLSHPALPTFIKMANLRGFRSVLTTNGTLLKSRGEALLDVGLHKVSISLHSFEENNESAFLTYMQEVSDFAEKASQKGIIVVFRLWNRGVDNGLNDRIFDFLRRRFTGEWAKNTRGIRIRHRLHLEWGDRFTWPDIHAPLEEGDVFCYGLSDHFGILCDGTVVPCCMDSDGIIALGNIFHQDLSDILSSPRAKALADGFAHRQASEELCCRCSFARRFL